MASRMLNKRTSERAPLEVSPYIRHSIQAEPPPSRLKKLTRITLGWCSTLALICYATYLCLFRPRKTLRRGEGLLPLMEHFHSADAYGSNPFVMFVNAYLHTLSTNFLRSIPFTHPSVELGAGDGSFSDFVFFGQRLTLVSSVLPSDIPHLIKRSVPERVAIIDAEQIPLPADSANFVFMVNTLYHIGNQKQALKEIGRVLKPGGLFAFNYIVPSYLSDASPVQRCLSALGLDTWRQKRLQELKHAHFIDVVHSPEEIQAFLEESNLEVFEWHPIASREAMGKAYTLYQLARTAHSGSPAALQRITQLRSTRKTIDTVLKGVFLPLVAKDSEDCERFGHLGYWVAARKRGTSQTGAVCFGFVCPACQSPFGDASSYDCTICGLSFPMIDGVPVFWTHESKR